MTVLSLFDGISCGRYVLDKLGINDITYYASEINPYATSISENNYPGIIRLGDVTKWRDWDIDWSSIKLVIGGSPCQGFSSAGKQGGTKATVNGVEVIVSDREKYHAVKKAGGVFLSQSHLFWEYVLILDHVKMYNPRVAFMLENVKMSKNNLDMITSALGVKPVFINSAVLSAQNRQRYYWCNWFVPEPQDRGLLIADILEHEAEHITVMSNKFTDRQQGRDCLVDNIERKASSFSAMEYVKNGRQGDYINMQVVKYNRKDGDLGPIDKALNIGASDYRGINRNQTGNAVTDGTHYRKFTPIECERLQGLPDNYTRGPSDTQRYIAIGNGWQCDTVEHILFWLFIFGVNQYENTPS